METKANYLMIGGFVLGVLALGFIFVFWMSNFAGGGKNYYIVFESSVAGLTTGSSVGFNGIRVGEVQTFALDPEIVFLDEPTAGLDPIGATDFDHLIRKLQQTLGPVSYTHLTLPTILLV